METRYEKKWKLPKNYFYQLLNSVNNSSLEFYKQYESRWVNSIYFDDFNNNSVYQNLDGNYHKEKIRLRWYGDFYKIIDSRLEVKKKLGTTSQKKIRKIILNSKNINNFFNQDFITQLNKVYPFKSDLKPRTTTRYLRHYFKTKSMNIRLTVDQKIEYNKFYGNKILTKSIEDNFLVLELKYSLIHDNIVRKNFKNITLRINKNSKFINSFFLRNI